MIDFLLSLILCRVVGLFLSLSLFFSETNLTPFDFVQAESELVSEFNIEFSGGGITLVSPANP